MSPPRLVSAAPPVFDRSLASSRFRSPPLFCAASSCLCSGRLRTRVIAVRKRFCGPVRCVATCPDSARTRVAAQLTRRSSLRFSLFLCGFDLFGCRFLSVPMLWCCVCRSDPPGRRSCAWRCRTDRFLAVASENSRTTVAAAQPTFVALKSPLLASAVWRFSVARALLQRPCSRALVAPRRGATDFTAACPRLFRHFVIFSCHSLFLQSQNSFLFTPVPLPARSRCSACNAHAPAREQET